MAMNDSVERSKFMLDLGEDGFHLIFLRHVAGENQRLSGKRGGQRADFLFRPLINIGERNLRARARQGLRDRPSDAPLIGDAEDGDLFAL